ncbi:MAG: PEGA domain-containing protein [Acidobacteriota bacterium]|nr:PEGA domain-containing protein [Acidobacteriota bacterium]
MMKLKLAITCAALGLFLAAGLPARAEAPHAASHPDGTAASQPIPPPAARNAVLRVVRTSAMETAGLRHPDTREAALTLRRVDDHDEGRDGGDGAVIVGLGDGWYGGPWADDWWGPGWGWGGGWGADGYAPYSYYVARQEGAIHIKVEPKTASVSVDGDYVGVVNDFNGFFQELKVAPGPHTITIEQKGYRTLTFHVKLLPGQTITYKGSMQKLP